MTPGHPPASARPSSLPDYYAEERQALLRVRRQARLIRTSRWLSLVVVSGVLLLLHGGR